MSSLLTPCVLGFSQQSRSGINCTKFPICTPRPISLITIACALGSIRSVKPKEELKFDTINWNAPPQDDEKVEKLVTEIKEKFHAMRDGHTSPSAYDTAWVARIKSNEDPTRPHFPMCLNWLRKNQLKDGSWGEPSIRLLYDRLLNTLSCILALKQWNTGEAQIEKGLQFMREHIRNLDKEDKTLMPCGFELVFPWILMEAKANGLDIPYDLPCLQDIMNLRENIIKKITLETMHSVPTPTLFSVEGLQDVVQWDRILKLQCRDGSFLNSPASTAAVYMHTNDTKCLQYLTNIINKLGDHVPCVYPVDTFERMWAVDTIQRLGIHHHFKEEISEALDYIIQRYSTKEGIGPAGTGNITDIDDTCMALRLLRLQGYPMSSDVLEIFKDEEGNPVSWPGRSSRAVTGMFNLYRYCQLAFPGETILKEFKNFSGEYLQNCLRNNKVVDSWSLKKCLDKEVARALEVPWTQSIARLEARKYIECYGEKDIWIGKTLYWMYNVNDRRYLELAKLDYNRLLSLYKREFTFVQEWWSMCEFDEAFVSKARPKESHFGIAASLYEPEFSTSRIAYTKCNCLENLISYLFNQHNSNRELALFCEAIQKWDPSMINSLPPILKAVFMATYDALNQMAVQISKVQGIEIFPYLHNLRSKQIEHYMKKREVRNKSYSFNNHLEQCKADLGLAMRLLPSLFLLGERVRESEIRWLDEKSLIQQHLASFLALFIDIQNHKNTKEKKVKTPTAIDLWAMEKGCTQEEALSYVEAEMEEELDGLVHEALKPSYFLGSNCRRIMLEHARIIQLFNRYELKGERNIEQALKADMDCMFTTF